VNRSPLKRSRKPLRRQSKRRRAEQPARRRCVAAVRARSGGWCEAYCSSECDMVGCDAHEIRPRAQGGDCTNPAECLWVCRRCHDWIHAHPSLSYALGLLKRRTEAA
jgi:hypothetical protein